MKIFLVGGAVRDEFLGLPVKDRDYVVVGATHEEMINLGFKQVGADFPVYLHPQTGEEYALARTERKTGVGYHGFESIFDPSVTLEDDLFRRDLTINAMARDLETGELIDPYDGLNDIKGIKLRHVSKHFAEDPVRVLRVARFAARYESYEIEPQTLSLMKQLVQCGELNNVTTERVWQEFSKAMMEKNPLEFALVLSSCGAWEALFGEEIPHHWKYHDGWFFKSLKNAAINNAPLEERVAILLHVDYTIEQAIAFLLKMKAPNSVIDICTKFMILLTNDISNSNGILTVLKKLDAISNPTIISRLLRIATFIDDWECVDRCRTLLNIAYKIRFVGFANLTEKQQKTLRGAEIGEAITKLRLKIIDSF